MKLTFARVLLCVLIVFEAIVIVAPRHGSRVSPLVRQAIETHKDGSPQEMEAAVREAQERETAGGARTAFIFFASVVGINGVLVYFFWNYGLRKAMA